MNPAATAKQKMWWCAGAVRRHRNAIVDLKKNMASGYVLTSEMYFGSKSAHDLPFLVTKEKKKNENKKKQCETHA